MIINAKLVTVQSPPIADGSGGETPGASSTVDVECCLDEVSRAQRISLEARIIGSTAVAYIPLPTTGVAEFKRRHRLTFTQAGETLAPLEAVEVIKNIHEAGESHWQVFLKAP